MAIDRYHPQLDGLRALAVAAVAWSHWERPYQFGIPFGAGVHLFYVLSGFLITSILLEVRDHAARGPALTAFYMRRGLRIFPAFYAMLALAWLAGVPPVRDTWGWHAAYLSNALIFTTGDWQGSFGHLWSLAVEEQFYLVWPWLIVFAPRRWLVPAVVAAIALAPVFRWGLAAAGYRENMLAVLTPGCLDSLGVGALLATTRWAPGARLTLGAAAALVAISVAQARGAALPLAFIAAKQTLQAVVFGWVVWRAMDGFGGVAGRVLSAAPVVYLGRISYGVYLVHGFAGDLLRGVGINSRELPEPLRFVVLAVVSVGLAAVSWRVLEAPLNGLKRNFPYAGKTDSTRTHGSAEARRRLVHDRVSS